jgi:subtilase family serine protease
MRRLDTRTSTPSAGLRGTDFVSGVDSWITEGIRVRRGRHWRVAVLSLAVTMTAMLACQSCVQPVGADVTSQAMAPLAPAETSSVFEGWQQPNSAVMTGVPNPATMLDVLFSMPLQDADLLGLAQAVSDPDSPSYRHYESVSWVASHMGASAATSNVVLGHLKANGIVGHLDPTTSYVEAAISVREASKLFHTTYRKYRLVTATGTEDVVAPASEPRLPSQLIGNVSLVLGASAVLSLHYVQAPVLVQKPTARTLLSTRFGSEGTPGGCSAGKHMTGRSLDLLTPKQYLTAYGVESLHDEGISGQGQAVAILSLAPGRQSDLATFTHCFGLATPRINNVAVGLGTPTSASGPASPDEIALDTQMVAAMAPRLSSIDVIDNPSPTATGLAELLDAPLNHSLLHGPMPKVVSISLGVCEEGGNERYSQFPLAYPLYEHLLMDAAANGISVVAASGDWGPSCNLFNTTNKSSFADRSLARLSVQFPSSSPFVTSVGGALFGLNANDSIKNEGAWNDLPLGVGVASGGGESVVNTRPWYQGELGLTGSGRLVPDVSLEADSSYPIATYCSRHCRFAGWMPGGGTSAATPLLAGGIALADQEAASHHEASLGLINPLLYELGADHSSALRDITKGNIDVYGLGCCTARPGYDEATGWGSVNFPAFIQAADSAAARS